MLVYFHGRGDWFFNDNPNNKFGPLLAHNFVFEDTETGETELTNEFFRLYDGIDQKLCNEFVGVFKLSKKDIAKYIDSNNFDHVEKLLPCAHEYSGFIISLEENGYLSLSKNDFDNCFFLIQKEIDMSCFEHKKISTTPYVINNKLTVYNDSDHKVSDEIQYVNNKLNYRATIYHDFPALEQPELNISINKLAEIILGMAIHKHNYSPEKPTQTAYKSIQKSLNSKQISIETSVIEKCLAYGIDVYFGRTTRNNEGKALSYNREMKTDIRPKVFLNLFDGMAMADYGHDHTNTKSKASGGNRGSIPSGLKSIIGYSLSADKSTVKKYLDKAQKLFHTPSQ